MIIDTFILCLFFDMIFVIGWKHTDRSQNHISLENATAEATKLRIGRFQNKVKDDVLKRRLGCCITEIEYVKHDI